MLQIPLILCDKLKSRPLWPPRVTTNVIFEAIKLGDFKRSNTPLPLFFYDNFFKMKNTILCKEEEEKELKFVLKNSQFTLNCILKHFKT